MPGTRPAKVVVFDLDGLLVDSESVIVAVAGDVCKRYGKTLTEEAVSKSMGKRPDEAWQAVADELGIPRTGEELFYETEELLKERWKHVKFMPGALRALTHLKAVGVPIGLATSTASTRIGLKLQGKEGMLGLFDFTVYGDEVPNGKPAPDMYFEAARRIGHEPHEILVVEDSPCGVKAAIAAGMRCIAVPTITDLSSYPEVKEDCDAGCAERLASLLDFRPERYGLPPFTDYVGEVIPLYAGGWKVKGTVVKGFGRGSKLLKIPTANIDMESVRRDLGGAVCGIFCGFARVVRPDGSDYGGVHPFAMSIGRNPVFNNKEKTAEPWILHDFGDTSFYGDEIRLLCLGYIRPEANFPGLEALIERIKRDGEVSKEFLATEAMVARKNDPFLLDA